MRDPARNPSQDDEWLTTKEGAEYLKVSEQTIFRWMRSGRLSFFKLGNATRFRRSHLDMVAQKVTSDSEAEMASSRCVVCGHSRLVEGRLRSTGRLYFQLDRSRFFVLAENATPVRARTCPVCGHVQLFADTDKLNRLLREEDRPSSADSTEPEDAPENEEAREPAEPPEVE